MGQNRRLVCVRSSSCPTLQPERSGRSGFRYCNTSGTVFCRQTDPVSERTRRMGKIFKLVSNSVITNSTGKSVFVRYNRDIVMAVSVYVLK